MNWRQLTVRSLPPKRLQTDDYKHRDCKENNNGDDKVIRATARADMQMCRSKDKAVLKFKLSCAAFLRFWRSFFIE